MDAQQSGPKWSLEKMLALTGVISSLIGVISTWVTLQYRIERLEEDKAAVMADMKEVFLEAKGEGYDVKILRKVIRIRKQDKAKRQEEDAILDLYLSALGEI